MMPLPPLPQQDDHTGPKSSGDDYSMTAGKVRLTNRAVEALERSLTCGQPGNELRAALGVLGHAVKAVEALDLAERVEELEHLLAEMRDDENAPPCMEKAPQQRGRSRSGPCRIGPGCQGRR